jgi:hypothetical protein
VAPALQALAQVAHRLFCPDTKRQAGNYVVTTPNEVEKQIFIAFLKDIYFHYFCINHNCKNMELILKSDNEESLAKIIALAKKLNVVIEKKATGFNKTTRANLKTRILNFKATTQSSFGDAAEWEQGHRADRELPFS